MSQAPSVAFALDEETPVGAPAKGDRPREHVSLRGTTRGLEILITGTPATASLGERLAELLAEAPSFFAGSDARVVFENPLPPGSLACLEEVATRFELRLVEISPLAIKRRRTEPPGAMRPDEVALADLAEGTGRFTDETLADMASPDAPTATAMPSASTGSAPTAIPTTSSAPVTSTGVPPTSGATALSASIIRPTAKSAPVATPSASTGSGSIPVPIGEAIPPGARLVIGPVRSGMIVDHPGHLVIVGDVNPGAEIRAEGSIVVLGRLRGVAHAAIGRDRGFIVALSLQPQQLRIARMVARAADADRPSDGAEIAYAAGETIVVERFLGRLPSGLAASM
ncbi:MAG TPA: septum site-determining protein MinC [Kofleriaceae bacterium]|nr:septum site-determining protein MinC [Kofleriaceae bacterium]